MNLILGYERSLITNRQSLHFNYYQSISATAKYNLPDGDGNSLLDPDAKKYMENGDLQSFYNKCGDGFIQTASMGAILLVDLSVTFSSHTEEESFKTKVDLNANIAKVMAEFEQYQRSHNTDIILNLRALQLGGDVTRLAEIFGNADYKKDYNIVSCSYGNFERCKQVLNDVIYYSQHVFENNVNFKDKASLYTFDHHDTEYSKLNIHAKLTPIPPAMEEAKDYIINTVQHNIKMIEYLEAYQKSPLFKFLSQDTHNLNTFTMALEEYRSLLNLYNNFGIIDACYGSPNDIITECIKAAESVKKQQNKYKDDFYFAENLANTILVQPDSSDKYQSWILIPYNDKSSCNKISKTSWDCSGDFAKGFPIHVEFADKHIELLWQWESGHNDHINRIINTLSDKMLIETPNQTISICIPGHSEINSMSKEIAKINDNYGRWISYCGAYVNFIDFGNVHFYYSDSTDFRYNPI